VHHGRWTGRHGGGHWSRRKVVWGVFDLIIKLLDGGGPLAELAN